MANTLGGENSYNFSCIACNFNTMSNKDYNRHIMTLKHKRLTNDEQKNPEKPEKKPPKFVCELCNFNCVSLGDYNKHLLTRKHKLRENQEKNPEKKPTPSTMYSCICGSQYKHMASLCKHKQRCSVVAKAINNELTINDTSSSSNPDGTLMMLIKQNNEFKDLIISQNNQIIELSKEKNIVNNIQQNNNSHNKTFNLNFFLNETCKDAMNITDFVNSLKLNLGDLEKVGELGYAEGISRMVVKGLTELEVTKRPIHCSDLKREILHIKDQDKWEKDNPSQDKLKKVIKDISTKNIMMLDDWRKENPGCKNYDDSKNDIYLRMMVESCGPADEVSEKRDFAKIIRSIAKNTIIDKDFK
jgi:hypothetical protein